MPSNISLRKPPLCGYH